MSFFSKTLLLGAGIAGLIAYEKRCHGNRCARANAEKTVDTSMDESFPASDPPAWNAGHAIGAPRS